MKKSLILWFAAVTCAALFLVGCESPTNGESGAAGTDGPYPLTDATVDADALKAAFYVSSRVAITDGSSGIDGEVPAGKTLYVLGSTAKVASGESLTVKGTLDIYEAAALDASYVSGTAGYLATSGGAITGTGTVSLPYLADGVTDGPTGIVTYGNSPGSITKTAGSYITGSAAAPASSPLDVDDIEALFTLPGGPAELTVSDIAGLTADAVPDGKTLTLAGAGNTVTGELDLASGGTLIVNGTLTDSTGVAIKAHGTTSNITINGTLALHANSTVVGEVTNNGTIESAATAATTQKALLTLAGDGKVVLSGVGAAVVDSATLALTQNVEITNSGTLKAPVVATPFSGGKTITISGTGVLDFGAAVAGLSLSGVTIVNNGTAAGAITTATTSDAALGVIMGAGGKITASADVATLNAALTVPAGVELTASAATFATGDYAVTVEAGAKAIFTVGTFAQVNKLVTVNGEAEFTAATFAALVGTAGTTILSVGEGGDATFTAATLATVAGDVVINGTAVFTAATFAALEGSTDPALVVGAEGNATFTAGTFAAVKGVTINGEASFPEATFAAATAINIGDGGILDIEDNSTFTTAQGSLVITSTGTGKIVSATTTATVLQALLGKAGATLNIEQGDAVTLAAASTVKAGTTLVLGASGSVTTATSDYDLTVKGKVIAGDVTIDGLNGVSGITTTYAAGVTVSYANGLSFGVNDKITIPAGGANVNVGGPNGITLGAGTYKATNAAVTIKLAAGVPTLSGTSNFVFNVGADTDEGGLLTVGSGSAIVKVGTAKVFTANTEEHPEAAKLAVNIAAGATITNSSDNDGGITLSDGAIATRTTTTIPGVSESVGLQLVGSDDGSAGWKAGNPAGAGT